MKMLRVLTVAAMLGLPLTGAIHSVAIGNAPVFAADPPPVAGDAPAPKIDVHVNDGTHVWYANPFVLAVGGIGLLVVVLLIALAARGGGTTIIKE